MKEPQFLTTTKRRRERIEGMRRIEFVPCLCMRNFAKFAPNSIKKSIDPTHGTGVSLKNHAVMRNHNTTPKVITFAIFLTTPITVGGMAHERAANQDACGFMSRTDNAHQAERWLRTADEDLRAVAQLAETGSVDKALGARLTLAEIHAAKQRHRAVSVVAVRSQNCHPDQYATHGA